jgi:4-carboxymuconolactone decarboxylase
MPAQDPASTRLPPLPAALDEGTGALLARLPQGPNGPINLMSTLAHAPALLRAWGRFTAALAGGSLPARDRELLILRTAWNTGSSYEWGHHVGVGLRAGLEEEEVLRSAEPGSANWSEADRLLVQAADDVDALGEITAETLAALIAQRSPQEAVHVTFVLGVYRLVDCLTRSLGVIDDEGLPALGELTGPSAAGEDRLEV